MFASVHDQVFGFACLLGGLPGDLPGGLLGGLLRWHTCLGKSVSIYSITLWFAEPHQRRHLFV